jgi:hypothetical protein
MNYKPIAYSQNRRARRRGFSKGEFILAAVVFAVLIFIIGTAYHNTDQVIKATNGVCHSQPDCWGK